MNELEKNNLFINKNNDNDIVVGDAVFKNKVLGSTQKSITKVFDCSKDDNSFKDYRLVNATEDDINVLIKYKLKNIFEYATDLSIVEKNKIKKYVDNHIPLQLKNYKMIIINNNIVGCLLVENKDDGVLLDEIYIEQEYRNKGIGTDIIKQVLFHNKIVYLWVYKANRRAISLYEKLDFKVLEETESRYYMKYKAKNGN